MDSKLQATFLKESGDISCSCRGRWSSDIFLGSAFPLIQWVVVLDIFTVFFTKHQLWLFQFTDLYFLCCWYIVFTLEYNFFFRAQTSCYCQFLKAVVRWPEEPDQRCQIKPLLLPWHFQLTCPARKLSEVHVHRLLAVKGNIAVSCYQQCYANKSL